MKRQWLEDSSDVDLWPTGRTDVKSFQAKFNEFLHELENLMARGWGPGSVWTFVERIQDDENWVLARQSQHLFQAFLQSVVTRLSIAIVVCPVNAVEDVTAGTGADRKLS